MDEKYNLDINALLKQAEHNAVTGLITAMVEDEQAREIIKTVLWGFFKRGVPASVVMEVFAEAALELGAEDA